MANDWEVAGTEPMPAGTTAGNDPWKVAAVEDAAPSGPQVAKPGDFKQESGYLTWLDQHKADPDHPEDVGFKGTGFEKTPEADHTLTVDANGNGVTHDLRGLWNTYATRNPVTGQKDLEPTAAQLDEFALPGQRGFTAASRFAQGLPPEQLGSWNDDHTEYHPPGWQPPSTASKILDTAKNVASKAYDNAVSTAKDPMGALDDAEQDIKDTIVNPLVTGFEKARQGGNVLAEQAGAQSPESAAAAIAAAEKSTPVYPAFRRAADEQIKNAGSAFGALDAYLTNPRAALAGALQGLSEGATTLGLSMGAGAAGGAVGGPVGSAVGAAAGGAAGGYLDAYGQTIVETLRASGVDMTDKDAVAQALKDPDLMAKAQQAGRDEGIPAAVINAASFGIAGKVFKPVAGAIASKTGSELAGQVAGIGAEAVTQGGVGAGGEAAKQEYQSGKITDPAAIAAAGTSQAALGGAFAALHGTGKPEAETSDETSEKPDSGDFGSFNVDGGRLPGAPPDVPAGALASPPTEYRTDADIYDAYQDALFRARGAKADKDGWGGAAPEPQAAVDQVAAFRAAAERAEQNGDASKAATLRDFADRLENTADVAPPKSSPATEVPAGAPAALPAPLPEDVARMADSADDAGDIAVSHGDEGSIVSVNNQPVLHTDDAQEADKVAAEARQVVEERRIDAAQRKKVADMTPAEKDHLLLTHELTGIPNRRAYDESDKLPVQVSIDMDSLKWVNDNGLPKSGDELLKAAATAFRDAAPGNAYHISGDEFRLQGNDHASVDQAIANARQRLAGAKIEFTGPNGDKITLNGIGFSHGKGSTIDEADAALKAEKLSRERQGLRAARGDEPPGTSRTAAEARLPDHQGQPAAEAISPRIVRSTEWQGLPIGIENEVGSTRAYRKPDGTLGSRKMKAPYGEFTGTQGADGDGVDVFLGKHGNRRDAYVIDQNHPDGSFDEHKVILGVRNADEAKALYHAHYQKGWNGFRGITRLTASQLKEWLKNGDKSRPLKPDKVVPLKPKKAIHEGNRGPNAKKDSILQYLARHGRGLDSEEAKRQGIDPADMGLPTAHVGIRRAFRKGGMSFDHAAETLSQEGYPVVDEHGRYSPNVLLERISDELAGRPHFSVRNEDHAEQLASQEADRQQLRADSADLQDEISPDIPALADEPAHIQEWADLANAARKVDPDATEAALEHPDDAVARQKLEEIIRAGSELARGEAPREGASAAGADRGEPPLLESYDQEEITRREQAEKARAEAQADAERKVQADKDREQFALTGSARPADANPAQADLVGFTPQGKKPVPSHAESEALFEPTRAYNDRQLPLNFGGEPAKATFATRPDTTPEDVRRGISDLVLLRDHRAGAAVLGDRIPKDFVAKGTVSLLGQKIGSIHDLALLQQANRRPDFEVLHFVLTKGGNVVHHTATSSRLPGAANFQMGAAGAKEGPVEFLQREMAAHGADGYWITHNHPSGSSAPSRGPNSDETFTSNVAQRVPGFLGHVVTNSHEYSTITLEGRRLQFATHPIKGQPWVVGKSAPRVEHPLLGKKIGNPQQLMAAMKDLDNRQGGVHVFAVSSNPVSQDVRAVTWFPKELVDYAHAKTKAAKLRIVARLRRVGVGSGGGWLFAIADSPDTLGNLPPIFQDVMAQGESQTFREKGLHWNVIRNLGRDLAPTYRLREPEKQPTFYSAVARAVESAKREKGTGAEWEATLRNMPGVKPEEMQWLGLKDWLDGRGRVTKAEVAAYVDAHRIEVGEHLKGMGNTAGKEHIEALREWMADNEDMDEIAQYADYHDETEKLIERAAEGDAQAIGDLEALGVPGNLLAPFYDTGLLPPLSEEDIEKLSDRVADKFGEGLNSEQDAILRTGGQDMIALLDDMESRMGIDMTGIRRPTREQVDAAPKYGNYVAPGGKNYRELLLTLPRQETPEIRALREQHEALANEATDYRLAHTEGLLATDPKFYEIEKRRQQALEKLTKARMRQSEYQPPHWDVPNVLVHTRFDERTLPTGERALHMAEIQSDWHHAGWEKGYRTMNPSLDDAKRFFGIPDDRWQALSGDTRERYREEMRDGIARNDRTYVSNAVPDAPFKTTWQDLALKRMLRYAVDKGFDALTWDTGKTVANRFNLSKEIGSLAYNGRDFVAFNKNGVQVHRHTGANQESIAQLVGKDIAQRLMQQPPKNGLRTLEGLDLDVGSAGKEAIYDKMLPSKMAKIVKPFGGNVERGTVTSALGSKLARIERQIAAFQRVHGLDTDEPLVLQLTRLPAAARAEAFDLDREHERVLAADGEGQGGEHAISAHIVRITPAMRAGVSEGLPLFEPQGTYGESSGSSQASEPAVPDDRTFLGRPGVLGKGYDAVRRAAMFPVTNEWTMHIRRLINPRSVSDVSKLAANRIIPFLADLARQKEIALERLEEFSREVDKLPYKEQLQAYHEAETGQPQSNPKMQPIMDALQKMLREKAEQIHAMGPGHLDSFIDNYLPHYYTDESKAKKFFAGPFGRRPLRGPATFKKQRYYATLRDAMEKGGLTPLTANPLIQTFLKLYEMERYMSGVSMLRDGLKADGLAKYFTVSQRLPEGWAKIDDPIARVSSWSEAEGGFVERGYYAMPEDAARLLNNHLGVNHLGNFAPADTFRAFANSMTMFQLGFSGFHLGFTSSDALISKNALAYERLAHGEPLLAAKAFLEAYSGPLGVLMNLNRGRMLNKAYLNPKGATPELQAIANAFVGGGGRIRMPVEYQTAQGLSPFHGVTLRHLADDLRAVMRDPQSSVLDYGRVVGSVALEYANKYWRSLTDLARTHPAWKVAMELAGRTVRASTAFIMEKIVPWQKQGVFVDLARDYLRRHPTASSTEVNAAMQEITHSIDNRLGEVVYDNNFWNRSLKMALHLSLRAVGWRFGTVQELGGGAHDFVKAADTLLRTGRLTPQDFTHKMAYLIALMTAQAISGSILQYLLTGEAPRDVKDVFFPRTGYFTKDGTAERISLPTYMKDLYGYLHQPGHEVASMLNPIIGELWYQMTNSDYRGDPVYDPNDTNWQQMLERADHFVKAYTPFVVEGNQNLEMAKRPGVVGALARVGNFFGLKPAPKAITNPDAVTEAQHHFDEQRYEKELQRQLREAREAKDTAKVRELRQKLDDLRAQDRKEKSDYLRNKRQGAERYHNQSRANDTSQVIDHVNTLIDQGGGRAAIAQRVQSAGYPALATLIRAVPDTLRPQVAAKLREYA